MKAPLGKFLKASSGKLLVIDTYDLSETTVGFKKFWREEIVFVNLCVTKIERSFTKNRG